MSALPGAGECLGRGGHGVHVPAPAWLEARAMDPSAAREVVDPGALDAVRQARLVEDLRACGREADAMGLVRTGPMLRTIADGIERGHGW